MCTGATGLATPTPRSQRQGGVSGGLRGAWAPCAAHPTLNRRPLVPPRTRPPPTPPLQGDPLPESAAEFIVRQAREHPGEVVVLALAALTNVALALHLDAHLPDRLVRGVEMRSCRACLLLLLSAAAAPPSGSRAAAPATPAPAAHPHPLSHPQAKLVVLGGAFCLNGNVNPAAEANIYGDPDAANVVFSRRATGEGQ